MYNKKFLFDTVVLKNRCKVTLFLPFDKVKSVKTAQISLKRAHF